MKRETLLLTGVRLAILCVAALIFLGRSYTMTVQVDTPALDANEYNVTFEQEREVVRLVGKRLDGGALRLTFQSVQRGKAYVDVFDPDGQAIAMEVFYVHRFGVLTANSYFGRNGASRLISLAAAAYLAMILCYVVGRYRAGRRESLYQYRNIRNLGWIVYVGSLLLWSLPNAFTGDSLVQIVRSTLGAASMLSFVAFPVAFVMAILVTLSNLQLMRREGRNWRNMLGMLLGLLICLGTFIPNALGEFLQRTTLVDVHNERGAALYIEMMVEDTILAAVTYLECILLSTIILSVKAAKHVPTFGKDYILIHGCQIAKDGTPTPLLRGRADRAMEFARMQREATGRDIVFVPSGGKGADEVISEAESIRNYLLANGVPAERILMEDRSINTEENMRFSAALVHEVSGQDEPKVAFATTNYHVFRSGILAERAGLHAEGIGSKTRSYFWINAFVREFIATLYAERKKHLLILAAMTAVTFAMIGVVYLSNTL